VKHGCCFKKYNKKRGGGGLKDAEFYCPII
jgi:hypothetical protein